MSLIACFLIGWFFFHTIIYIGKKFAKDGALKSIPFFRVLVVQFFYPNVSHQCFFCRIFLLPLVRVVTSSTVGMFFDIWYTLDLGCCRHVKSIVYLHGWIVISEDFVDPKFESTCRWLFPNILLCSPPNMER